MIFGGGDQRSRVSRSIAARAPAREAKKDQEQAFDIHRFMAGKTGGNRRTDQEVRR
jgi:hypothetical protein